MQEEVDFNAQFIVNILPRIEWDALIVTAAEVCYPKFGVSFGLYWRREGGSNGDREPERAREVVLVEFVGEERKLTLGGKYS